MTYRKAPIALTAAPLSLLINLNILRTTVLNLEREMETFTGIEGGRAGAEKDDMGW